MCDIKNHISRKNIMIGDILTIDMIDLKKVNMNIQEKSIQHIKNMKITNQEENTQDPIHIPQAPLLQVRFLDIVEVEIEDIMKVEMTDPNIIRINNMDTKKVEYKLFPSK
jgi:hypothetical protein